MTEIPVVDVGGGAVMPMVGFGTWQLGGRRGYEAIRNALDIGYRHIDTATVYRNEHEVGQAGTSRRAGPYNMNLDLHFARTT